MTYSVQLKNGIFQTVICYTDTSGKKKYKWVSTGLKEKGNKKKAVSISEQVFQDFKRAHTEPSEITANDSHNPLYSDFLKSWLNVIKPNIQQSTYQGYSRLVKEISEHFKGIRLNCIQAIDIQNYYTELSTVRKLTGNSILHYHAIIRKSLQYAVKMDLLVSNAADKIERPKKNKFKASYYNNEDLQQLFIAFKGDRYELLVKVVAYYGLRRSEALGLMWDAINFDDNTITIKRKLVEVRIDGEHLIIPSDTLKNETSNRTLPLMPEIKELLEVQKKRQELNKQLCKSAYNYDYDGYIFCDDLGNVFYPDAVTQHFPIVLRNNNLRHIRFHDLRHSCASLLLANNVSMKEIQLWLGHSSFSTTADIYSHLDFSSKVSAAEKISHALKNKSDFLATKNPN